MTTTEIFTGAKPGPVAPGTPTEPEPRPATDGAPARAPRSTPVVVAGRVFTALGVGVCLFALYAFVFTDLVQDRRQHLLTSELEDALRAARPGSAGPSGAATSGEGSGLLGEARQGPRREVVAPVAPGSPVALLRIPRIGLEAVVVEGTGASQLRAGPGHFRGTPLPGEPGNAGIAGRRSTFGAPFSDLGRLRRGDRIEVVTRGGRFTYRVSRPARRLQPGAPDPLQNTPDDRLTLLTSTPWGLARDPLVVQAELRGIPVVPVPGRTLGAPAPAESGFGVSPGAGYAVLVWGLVVGAATLATARLYRRFRWAPIWLITTPILLAALLRFFESVTELFPATW